MSKRTMKLLKGAGKTGETITKEQAKAILEVVGGADVYGYSLAKTLRTMQRDGIGVGLFEITDAMDAPKDGAKQQPYFGAIATDEGIVVATKVLKGIEV